MRRPGVVIILSALMLLGGVSCEWYTPWTWFAKAEEVKVEDPVDKLLNYNKAEWLAKIDSAEKNINGFPQISEDFKVQVQTCQSTQDLILQSVTNILNKAVYVVEMPNNEPFVSYFEVKAVPKPDPKEDVEDGDKPEPSEGGGGSESIESGKEEKPSEKPTEEKSEPAKETTSSSGESGSQEGTSEDRESSSERHHRILTKSRDTSRNYNQILVLEKILHRLERRHRQEGESLRESSRGGKDGRTSTEIRRGSRYPETEVPGRSENSEPRNSEVKPTSIPTASDIKTSESPKAAEDQTKQPLAQTPAAPVTPSREGTENKGPSTTETPNPKPEEKPASPPAEAPKSEQKLSEEKKSEQPAPAPVNSEEKPKSEPSVASQDQNKSTESEKKESEKPASPPAEAPKSEQKPSEEKKSDQPVPAPVNSEEKSKSEPGTTSQDQTKETVAEKQELDKPASPSAEEPKSDQKPSEGKKSDQPADAPANHEENPQSDSSATSEEHGKSDVVQKIESPNPPATEENKEKKPAADTGAEPSTESQEKQLVAASMKRWNEQRMDSDKAVANLNELKKDANEIKQYFQVVAEGLRNIHPK